MRKTTIIIPVMLVRLVAARAQSGCENTARSVELFEAGGLAPDDIATNLAPLERLSEGQSDARNCHAWVCLKIADVFARVQNRVRSTDVTLQGDRAGQLEREYAALGLHEPNLPIVEIEVALVSHFRGGPAIRNESLPSRLTIAQYWVHAWMRFEKEYVPNFDFNDRPFLNVSVPRGVPGVAGMAPEGISDPAVRQIYEKAIADNKRKAEQHVTQLFLRRDKPDFLRRLEHFFATSFSPTELNDVQESLKGIADTAEKARILRLISGS